MCFVCVRTCVCVCVGAKGMHSFMEKLWKNLTRTKTQLFRFILLFFFMMNTCGDKGGMQIHVCVAFKLPSEHVEFS